MPNGKDKLKKLHANLVSEGYDLPDFNTFDTDMADSTKRDKMYKSLVGEGYELPDFDTFSADMGYSQKKNEPAPSIGAPVGSPSISGGTPPPVEKISFDPNKVRGYEDVLQQYAGIGRENANKVTEQKLGTFMGRTSLMTPTGGTMTLPESYPLLPEMAQKKVEVEKQLKAYEAELNPKFDAAIKSTLGKFTTKDGQVDYGKIYATAEQTARSIGGGNHTKEIVAQKMIAAEQLNQMKPQIDEAANKVFKAKTGKTIDEFYKEKGAQIEAEAIKEKTYVETQFANEQQAANERLQQRAKEDFDNYYKPQLDLAVDEEDYNGLVNQYVSSLKNMQAEENSRLKRLGQEMYRAANQKIEALSKKTNITDKEKAAIDEAYKVGYKTAVEQKFAGEAAKQQILAGLPGGKTSLAAKALYEGFNLWLSSAGAGLVGLGMNNGLTDWLRSKQETADRFKTTDIPLEGKNWFDPNAYTTRLMKQLGMQGIPMAATLLTRSPTLGATLGVASESIQVMGDTYNQVLQETGNPAQAENAARSVGENNAKLMPLYFMEADLLLKATKGGIFKGLATNIGQVPVEFAQEAGQGFAQDVQLNDRNFGQYLKEEGGELFKETAVLTILQQGAFGGIGDIYNTLGKNNKGVSTQYILDVARKEGLAKAGAIAEQLALKGSLSEIELADTKELISSITGDIEAMREAGANETQIQGYIANMAEADAIKKQEAQLSATSPVKQQLASKRMQLEQDAKKLVTGEGTTVTVTMPNGTVVGVPQANAAATIDGLSTQIADGQVTVQAEGENAAAINEQVAEIQPAARRLQGRLKRTAKPKVETEVVAVAEPEAEPKKAVKPTTKKPLSELTSEEIGEYRKEVKQFEKDFKEETFGAEGAKKFDELGRKAEALSLSDAERKAAAKERQDMIGALPEDKRKAWEEEQEVDVLELRDIESKVRFVEEAETLDDLAESLKNPMSSFDAKKPSQESLAVFNAARRKAAELKISPEDLLQATVKKISAKYPDPADAELMVRNALQQVAIGTTKTEAVEKKALPAAAAPSVEVQPKAAEKSLNEKQQELVNKLPKQKVNYKELKGIGDLSVYLNNPEALNFPHLKSAKKIYEEIKEGKSIKDTPYVNEKLQVMDGQNRIAAQLAAGIEDIDVAIIDKSFYDNQDEELSKREFKIEDFTTTPRFQEIAKKAQVLETVYVPASDLLGEYFVEQVKNNPKKLFEYSKPAKDIYERLVSGEEMTLTPVVYYSEASIAKKSDAAIYNQVFAGNYLKALVAMGETNLPVKILKSDLKTEHTERVKELKAQAAAPKEDTPQAETKKEAATAPEISLPFISTNELSKAETSQDMDNMRQAQDAIKEKFKDLKKISDCIWKA